MCASPCRYFARAFLTLFHTIKTRNLCQAQSVWKNPHIRSDVCFQAIPLCAKGLYVISDSFWSFRFSTIQSMSACWVQQPTLWILLSNRSFTSTTDFRPSINNKNPQTTQTSSVGFVNKQKHTQWLGLSRQQNLQLQKFLNKLKKNLITQSSLCECYRFSVL